MDNATFTADVIARLLEKVSLVPSFSLAHVASTQATTMEEKQTSNTGDSIQPAPVIAQTVPESPKHAPAVTQAEPTRVYSSEPRPGDDFADVNVALEFLRRNVHRPLKNQFSEELEFSWSDFPALIDHIKPIVCDARLMWFQNWGRDDSDVRCVKTQWIHVPSRTETWTIYYPENARLPSLTRQSMIQAAAEETFHFRRAMYAALGIRPGDDEEDVKVQKKRHYRQKALAEAANDVRPWRDNASNRTKDESLINVLVASGRAVDPRVIAEAKSKNPDLTTPEDEKAIAAVMAIPEMTERALFWLRQLCSMSDEFRYYLDDPRAKSNDLPRQLWLRACEQAALEYVGGDIDPTIPTDPVSVAMPHVKTYPAPVGMEHVKRTWDAFTLDEHAQEMANQLNKCRLLMAKTIPNAEMLATLKETKRRCDTATCAVIDGFIEVVTMRPDVTPRTRTDDTAPVESAEIIPPMYQKDDEEWTAWDSLRHQGRMSKVLDDLMIFAASWMPSAYKLAHLQRQRDRKDIDYPTKQGIDKLLNGIKNNDAVALQYWRNRSQAQDDEYTVANAVSYVTPVQGVAPFSSLAEPVIAAVEPETAAQLAKRDRKQKKAAPVVTATATSTAAPETPVNPVITLCQNAINTYTEGDDPECVVEFLCACRSHTDEKTAGIIGVMIDDFSITTSLSTPLVIVGEDDLPY